MRGCSSRDLGLPAQRRQAAGETQRFSRCDVGFGKRALIDPIEPHYPNASKKAGVATYHGPYTSACAVVADEGSSGGGDPDRGALNLTLCRHRADQRSDPGLNHNSHLPPPSGEGWDGSADGETDRDHANAWSISTHP